MDSQTKSVFLRFTIKEEFSMLSYSFRVKIGFIHGSSPTMTQLMKVVQSVKLEQDEYWKLTIIIEYPNDVPEFDPISPIIETSVNQKIGISPSDTEFSLFKITDMVVIVN